MHPTHIFEKKQNLEEVGEKKKETKRPNKNRLKKIFWWITVFLILFFTIKWFYQKKLETKNEDNVEYGFTETYEENREFEKKDTILEHTISEGDIPAEVFKKHGGFDANDTHSILSCAKDVYDFTNIKIGQNIRFCFDEGEEKAKRMEYDKNTESMIIVEKKEDGFEVKEEKIPYEVSQETVFGKIKNFFYVDAMETGMSEATILEISDVFSFDIDFTTDIQLDDEFVVIYEKRTREGKKAPDGKILGAKFINNNKSFYAYYFDNDGKGGHYDSDGRALERQFLKAPLSFRRISSGFTGARLHPITKKISAHYQIDYAAPTGTPVVASAHGTVVSAGWEGGWGNIIRLRHDNGYTSHYGHLSKFAKDVRSGVRVKRGQVIGYVGSTGWSTGPHLDYGIKLNGSPVNPLKMNLPKGEPLSQENMKVFEELKNKYNEMLK